MSWMSQTQSQAPAPKLWILSDTRKPNDAHATAITCSPPGAAAAFIAARCRRSMFSLCGTLEPTCRDGRHSRYADTPAWFGPAFRAATYFSHEACSCLLDFSGTPMRSCAVELQMVILSSEGSSQRILFYFWIISVEFPQARSCLPPYPLMACCPRHGESAWAFTLPTSLTDSRTPRDSGVMGLGLLFRCMTWRIITCRTSMLVCVDNDKQLPVEATKRGFGSSVAV